MNEIKVGDWIEVTKVSSRARKHCVMNGDKFKVVDVSEDQSMVYAFSPSNQGTYRLETDHVVKIDTPKQENERPASDHYKNANNNDVWQFVDDNLSIERVKGFHQTNALKYVVRYHTKHETVEKRIEDLEKAKVSIDKLIELEKKE